MEAAPSLEPSAASLLPLNVVVSLPAGVPASSSRLTLGPCPDALMPTGQASSAAEGPGGRTPERQDCPSRGLLCPLFREPPALLSLATARGTAAGAMPAGAW